ncbi:hypothetical protein BCT89_21680 [Vibrio lentus]|nr:hypothetical protein BCT89_21680 [Vibrio lentus]
MIRYFGFLANRVVGNKLSKVRNALGMERNPTMTPPLRYGQMMKSIFKNISKNIVNEALSRRCFPPNIQNLSLKILKSLNIKLPGGVDTGELITA